MLQRVQTLFLLAAIACMSFILAFPIWSKINDNYEKVILDAYSLKHITTAGGTDIVESTQATFYIALAVILTIISCFYTIFQFKNRIKQIRLISVNGLFIAATIALMFFYSNQGEDIIDSAFKSSFKIAYILPLVAYVFNLLAKRFIKKDEKTVRSVDRLR